MKKLFAYFDKIGASYEKKEFGSSYFSNVPKMVFPVAFVEIEYSDCREQCFAAVRVRERIEKYCKRYNYIIFGGRGWYGVQCFFVGRADDLEELETLRTFEKDCQNSIEKYIHLRACGAGFSGLTDQEFNDYLCGVMEFHGSEYLEFKKHLSSDCMEVTA